MRDSVLQIPPKENLLHPTLPPPALNPANVPINLLETALTNLHERGRQHLTLPLLQEHQQETKNHGKVHSEHERKTLHEDLQSLDAYFQAGNRQDLQFR